MRLQYAEIDPRLCTITLLQSDGQTNARPTNTQRRVDAAGQVNFMDIPTQKKDKEWRVKIGGFLAKHLGLQKGEIMMVCMAIFC
jgi:hypothetical protein